MRKLLGKTGNVSYSALHRPHIAQCEERSRDSIHLGIINESFSNGFLDNDHASTLKY